MPEKKETKKYTAKQLRLTNEEIVEKFAVYWAEVDWVARKMQTYDRVLEAHIWKFHNIEKKVKELERAFDILCLTLTISCIVVLAILYI